MPDDDLKMSQRLDALEFAAATAGQAIVDLVERLDRFEAALVKASLLVPEEKAPARVSGYAVMRGEEKLSFMPYSAQMSAEELAEQEEWMREQPKLGPDVRLVWENGDE